MKMTEDVLKTIEELMNYYDEYESMGHDENDEEKEAWATNHKMGLYALLQEYGYDYERDESGKLKVIKEEKINDTKQ